MPSLPDVILHIDYLTSDNPDWTIKGENNCGNDYSDYCSREEAFQNKELKIAKQELYKEYKKNKLNDFYSRAGNSVLKELKSFSENSCVLSEKETDIFEEMETSEIIQTKIDTMDNSEQLHSADDIYASCVLSEKEKSLAQYTLGKMHLTGEVVDQDKTMAIKYLTVSAEQNNEYAQYALGNFFLSDREYMNVADGIKFMKQSADDNNNQFAQYTLGKMYLAGEITPQNKTMAIKYLTASAEQNNEFAQYVLGKLLLNDENYRNIPEAFLC